MDVEHHGHQDKDVSRGTCDRQTSLFALAMSDCVVVNLRRPFGENDNNCMYEIFRQFFSQLIRFSARENLKRTRKVVFSPHDELE